MLQQIDRLAAWWFDWRQRRAVKAVSDVELKAITALPDEWRMDVIAPSLFELIHEATALLNAQNAENYIQFDMLPRADRTGLRPVRVTIQWANGESPAAQNARLREEVMRLRAMRDSNAHP